MSDYVLLPFHARGDAPAVRAAFTAHQAMQREANTFATRAQRHASDVVMALLAGTLDVASLTLGEDGATFDIGFGGLSHARVNGEGSFIVPLEIRRWPSAPPAPVGETAPMDAAA